MPESAPTRRRSNRRPRPRRRSRPPPKVARAASPPPAPGVEQVREDVAALREQINSLSAALEREPEAQQEQEDAVGREHRERVAHGHLRDAETQQRGRDEKPGRAPSARAGTRRAGAATRRPRACAARVQSRASVALRRRGRPRLLSLSRFTHELSFCASTFRCAPPTTRARLRASRESVRVPHHNS
jgi:hypothetical protein